MRSVSIPLIVNREVANSRKAGIFIRDTAWFIVIQWTITHSSLNHNENMPYPIWKCLPYGSLQHLYHENFIKLISGKKIRKPKLLITFLIINLKLLVSSEPYLRLNWDYHKGLCPIDPELNKKNLVKIQNMIRQNTFPVFEPIWMKNAWITLKIIYGTLTWGNNLYEKVPELRPSSKSEEHWLVVV